MTPLNERRVQRAIDTGWDVEEQTFHTVQSPAVLTGVDHVTYVLLYKGWICSACGREVHVSQFGTHSRQMH
jgi:hypothetical protein